MTLNKLSHNSETNDATRSLITRQPKYKVSKLPFLRCFVYIRIDFCTLILIIYINMGAYCYKTIINSSFAGMLS